MNVIATNHRTNSSGSSSIGKQILTVLSVLPKQSSRQNQQINSSWRVAKWQRAKYRKNMIAIKSHTENFYVQNRIILNLFFNKKAEKVLKSDLNGSIFNILSYF